MRLTHPTPCPENGETMIDRRRSAWRFSVPLVCLLAGLLLAGHARVKVTLDRLVSFAGVRAETRPEPGLLATLPRRVLN
ncbi:hypothetical protein GR254_05880 [Mycobacterium tuberculosis]|nr:hypothetical protein [Mycobacterium tuberculosis]